MFNEIIYYPILGKPLIMYVGIITLLAFFNAAYFGLMAFKGKKKISQHFTMVKIALSLGIIHGVLGILAFF